MRYNINVLIDGMSLKLNDLCHIDIPCEDAMERESNGHTIFIVEDNDDLLSLMQRQLQREGYETAGAVTGR